MSAQAAWQCMSTDLLCTGVTLVEPLASVAYVTGVLVAANVWSEGAPSDSRTGSS